MKVTQLDASNVHGYLPISIKFHQELTFLTGLNGSGKTTALRLLMGLLAPSLEDLIDITFSSATAVVKDSGREIEVKATRSTSGLDLSISTAKGSLELSTAALQLLLEARLREEHQPLYTQISADPVFRAIKELSTPMFLGLDRRLHMEDLDLDPSGRIRRREIEYRHRFTAAGETPIRRVTDAILVDVNDLVVGALSEIRAAQERLDENLRNQILLDSFRYDPASPQSQNFPTRAALNTFRERQAAIEKAAAGLRLPVGELQSSLSEFFERITRVIDELEEEKSKMQGSAKSKSKVKKRTQTSRVVPKNIVEWMMNSRQADRIFKQIELLDDYVAKRATLHEPIDRFLALTNGFLDQTKKKVKVSARGDLSVRIDGTDKDKGLFALSSGERQLIVMLAHLSLNKRLAKSGIFIVDEPELSLHIG